MLLLHRRRSGDRRWRLPRPAKLVSILWIREGQGAVVPTRSDATSHRIERRCTPVATVPLHSATPKRRIAETVDGAPVRGNPPRARAVLPKSDHAGVIGSSRGPRAERAWKQSVRPRNNGSRARGCRARTAPTAQQNPAEYFTKTRSHKPIAPEQVRNDLAARLDARFSTTLSV